MTSRYIVDVDHKDDVVTLTDTMGELKTEFDSEIMLAPADEAITVIDKLNWYEYLVKELMMHLTYHGWTEDNFKDLIEEVELNLE